MRAPPARRNKVWLRQIAWACLAAVAWVSPVAAQSGHDHPAPVVLAPGYGDLEFDPPPAGSYRLPPLWQAPDAPILLSDGRAARLHELMGDRIVVLSFIYTSCNDVNGCPLATFVLKGLQDEIAADPRLHDQVRLVSFSFDPGHDTPAVLDAYAAYFRRPGFDWPFCTAATIGALAGILEDYDQWVIPDLDPQGRPRGSMSHVLRVYLVDRHRQVRNIYSVSFLHADTVANDIRTLILEEKP